VGLRIHTARQHRRNHRANPNRGGGWADSGDSNKYVPSDYVVLSGGCPCCLSVYELLGKGKEDRSDRHKDKERAKKTK
jgi:hypothetical protein